MKKENNKYDATQNLLSQAEALFNEQNFNDAAVILDNLIAEDPSNHMSWFLLGNVCMKIGRKQEAFNFLKKAESLNFLDIKTKLLICEILFKEKQYADIIPYAREIINLDKTCSKAWLYKAESFFNINNMHDSYKAYKEYINLVPDDHRSFSNLGCIASNLNDNDNAIAYLSNAIELNKNNLSAYNNLASIYLKEQKFEQAHNILTQALSNNHGDNKQLSNIYQKLAQVNISNANYDEAMLNLENALNIEPNNLTAIHSIANLLYLQKNYAAALQQIFHYLNLKPNDIAALMFTVKCLYQLREFKKANQYLDKIYIDNKNHYECLYYMGLVAKEVQNYESAFRLFNHINTLFPETKEHHYYHLLECCIFLENSSISLNDKHNDNYQHLMIAAAYANLNFMEKNYNDIMRQLNDTKISFAPNTENEHTVNCYLLKSIIQHENISFVSKHIQEHNKKLVLLSPMICTFQTKHKKYASETINIGYLLHNMQNCYYANNIHNLLTMHSTKFKIFAYPVNNLKQFDDRDIATKINLDEIDVLIDLTVNTVDHRSNILALNPATLQLSVDHNSVLYSDLNTTFLDIYCLPTNTTTEKKQVWRDKFNLPVEKIVLNGLTEKFELNLTTIKHWLTILNKTNNTILWLSKQTNELNKKIITIAKEMGIDKNRIILTGPKLEQSLWVNHLSDLILDTNMLNGITRKTISIQEQVPFMEWQNNYIEDISNIINQNNIISLKENLTNTFTIEQFERSIMQKLLNIKY